MATVRKYKPKGYFRGGRVLDDMPIADDAPADAGGFPAEILGLESAGGVTAAPPERGVSETPREEPPPADDNPLQRALDAQRHAENLQQSTLDREIGKLPLSDFKKHFLRQHPELVTDEFRSRAMGFHYQQALASGVEDDSPAMSAYVLAGVDREIAHVREQAIENVRVRPTVEEEVRRLDAEVEAGLREQSPAPPPTKPPPIMPPPARRSIPMSAPVSRDAPSYSGKPQSNPMTLSPEERDIAHRSYSAPDMTDAQKEYAYAKNKQRLKQMRQSGEYPDRETN